MPSVCSAVIKSLTRLLDLVFTLRVSCMSHDILSCQAEAIPGCTFPPTPGCPAADLANLEAAELSHLSVLLQERTANVLC